MSDGIRPKGRKSFAAMRSEEAAEAYRKDRELQDKRVCSECGSERNCLTCDFVGEGPYNILCYRGHYGVRVGEGCDDWSCRKCAGAFKKALSARLAAMTPQERQTFMRSR